ncbi:MAG: M1 family aminopeptidase [Bryobacteraceae bacterium]
MRWVVWAGVWLWPCLAQGAVSAADVAREVREISLDPGECYRVRDLALPRDEIRIFLTDGYLIFAKPVAGVRMSAVFTSNVEGGDAELLVLPPNRGERQSLASYTGSPNLDEHFVAAALIFSDDTYAKLNAQIHQNAANRKAPEMGAMMAEHWTPVLRNLASSFQARLVWDVLLGEPQSHGFLAVSMSGRKLGNFDVYYDRSAREQIVIGQLNTRNNLLFFDVWSSFVARSFREREAEPGLTLDNFRIDATLKPDLNLEVVTRVKVKPGRVALPVMAFDIAEPMRVSAALVDGKPAEVLQRDSIRADLLRNVGNEMFLVVPPAPLEPGKEYELEFRHAGKVIFDAGNRVYYVGARANWFPNIGLQFAKYDLTFRYPKDLDLVTAGEMVEEHDEGDLRVTRRRTSAPIRMAGFNLGQYERVRLKRSGYTLEVCANRAIETALEGDNRTQGVETPAGPRATREPEILILPPELAPDPEARLQEIASEIASMLEFMAARFGPPALPTLMVAPVPGRFGQGFPGLIYLSTMSYLAPQTKAIRSLDAHGRLFFSDILQAHETAHQWWGNVVTSAGYHDEWLMEALADYSALLYLENKNGSQPVALQLDSYKANLLQMVNGKTVESTGPIVLGVRLENSQTPAAYYNITYGKGSWIMHMLRRRMGDDRFLEMLADLRKEYERKPLSTEEFRMLAARFLPAQSADPQLENFFDQWVYGTGIPLLKMSYTVKGKGGGLRLSGTITQSDVAGDFSVLAPVEIQLAHGKAITHWVATADGAVTFSLALPSAPVKVQLDPNFSLLRR